MGFSGSGCVFGNLILDTESFNNCHLVCKLYFFCFSFFFILLLFVLRIFCIENFCIENIDIFIFYKIAISIFRIGDTATDKDLTLLQGSVSLLQKFDIVSYSYGVILFCAHIF